MNSKNIIVTLLFLAILVFLAWTFSDILIYIFVAMVISIIGSPIMRLLDKIHIKNWRIPQFVSSFIALFSIIGIIVLIFSFLIPLIINEFQYIASIDPSMFTKELDLWFANISDMLNKIGVLNDESITEAFSKYYTESISEIKFSNIAGNIFSFAGSLFIATFSIIFLSFFAMKDKSIFFKMIRKFIPTSYRENYDHILQATKTQVIRYFSGVAIEMVVVGTCEGLIALILGLPNPVLIGVVGGLLNIIPYVGPIIALLISIVISVTSLLPTDPTSFTLTMTMVKVVITFGIVKTIDDFVLQPQIYGKSVNAHPIEIFIIILIAGSVGGILTMIIAVPSYSLIRIVVKEFFGEYFIEKEKQKTLVSEDISKQA